MLLVISFFLHGQWLESYLSTIYRILPLGRERDPDDRSHVNFFLVSFLQRF